MRESQYQTRVIRRVQGLFPEAIVLRNDPQWIQGVPDILILYCGTWAALEVKLSAESEIRPNQRHFVALMDKMSFAAFVYPENEEEVMNELQQAFAFGRPPRVS